MTKTIKKLNLLPEEIEDLSVMIKEEKNADYLLKLQTVHLLSLGLSGRDVSIFLQISEHSISIWKKEYLKNNFVNLLKSNRKGGRKSELDKIKSNIIEKVEQDNIMSAKELNFWINENFSISYDISWLRKYLKKNAIYLSRKVA
ncbi:MAG: hypothetical protein COB02_03240 [Candidatus Cloacimonadota bacterium]|nr:MAG: hypothetical protein COB02_03240 [Candidatus Cloacimonadota bacterium]